MRKEDGLIFGQNTFNEIVDIELTELTHVEGHIFNCPSCAGGFLKMNRDPSTGILSEYDVCLLCGQQFRYTDIDCFRFLESDISKLPQDKLPHRTSLQGALMDIKKIILEEDSPLLIGLNPFLDSLIEKKLRNKKGEGTI